MSEPKCSSAVTERFIIVEDLEDVRQSVLSYEPLVPQLARQRTFDSRSILSRSSVIDDRFSDEKFAYNNRFYLPGKTLVGSDYKKSFSTAYLESSSTLYQLETASSSSPIVETRESTQLIQGLRPHNVAFITLCLVFGTGLFITSTATLQMAGPLFLIVGYALTGLLVYQVVTALLDMTTYIPLPDNFSGFAERFVDPALGFATGYAFLLTFLLFAPNQILAATLTMLYWIDPQRLSPAVWISVFITLVALVNYCKVTKYAHLVDAFITIKLAIYLILAITLVCLICGGSPKHEALGFRYWANPGPVASYGTLEGPGGKIVALIMATVKSVWSYVGIESFLVAAIETVNPRETIPKARKTLFSLLFPVYLIMAFLIGTCVSHTDPGLLYLARKTSADNARASVIFIALYNASLGIMGNFVNAALLIFIFSAANTGFYLSTRILYGLSASGMAPSLFMKTTKNGVPFYAFGLVLLFNLVAFISARQKTVETYHYFVDATSLFSLVNWLCILYTHIRFLGAFKKQGCVNEFKTYVPRSTTSCVPSAIALVAVILLIFANNLGTYLDAASAKTLNIGEFVAGTIAIPIFIALYLGYKVYYRTTMVRLEDADLFFYRDVVDSRERAYLQQKMASVLDRESMSLFQRLRNRVQVISVLT